METINNERKVTPKPKTLYTGKTFTTGGREAGKSVSDDGNLDIALSTPGSGKPGTNPEQLFGSAWSACFIGAVQKAAHLHNVTFPANASVQAEIDLVLEGQEYYLNARLIVALPGLEKTEAEKIVSVAHTICPYSKAIRGNVDVLTTLKTQL